MRNLACLVALSLSLLACSGSSGNKGSAEPKGDPVATDDSGTAAPQETPEEKFARQQGDTCNKMCQRLTDCSVEDAKATMTPEELEKLDLDATVPKAIEDCSQQCSGSPLSPRQVIAIRECLGQPTECSAFNECLGNAQAE